MITTRARGLASVLRAAFVLTLLVGATVATSAGTANAGPYREGCNAWAHPTSPTTSGVSALCTGGPVSVQYRVVGLCKNRFTASSRWVYGWWMNDGVSHYGCSWSEVAMPNPYYQTR